MRAFHFSWFCFFIAFFIWFAIAPLLTEIKQDLGLSKQQVWTSSIVGVGGTIAMRFILGPACDKWGARIPMAALLCAASIPTACTGLVNSATGLTVLRLFIGTAGGTFVMCQYWSSRMFCKEVVGTANALCGGWGNLGGGVTQLVMGSGLFPLFKIIYDGDSTKAWRTVCIIPAIVGFGTGVATYYLSDDAPKGNYSELKKHGQMAEVSVGGSFRQGALNINTWLLFIQYACCFGVELTMNNAAALYFKDKFELTTETAAAIASIFGFMNLFARGLGGFLSDVGNKYMGMRGRLWAQTICLISEGILVLVFAETNSLGAAITVMVFFSLFVQAAEGTSYGIVPYVDPPVTGVLSGIIGAGGNTGAVCFGLGFRNLAYKDAFTLMGWTIIGSSALSLVIFIKGHAGLVCGKDAPKEETETLEVPAKDPEATEE
jgi:NNP family nitrate/nitrite transporter-like MFS transporter